MDAATIEVLRKLDAAAAALAALPEVGAKAYIAGFRNDPIVDKHFTAGNQGRYGWAPLSRDYFLRKAGQAPKLRADMKTAGRKVSKLDKAAGFRSSTGELSGEGTGANLPMLVRTGATREAVTSRTHRIERQGDVAIIVFANLPEYALHLHTGTGKMPKRSPVEPGVADIVEIHAAMTQFIDRAIGTGGTVPVSGTTVPGVARFRPS